MYNKKKSRGGTFSLTVKMPAFPTDPGLIPGSLLQLSTNVAPGGSSDRASNWIPATHMEDAGEDPRSWLWSNPLSATVGN